MLPKKHTSTKGINAIRYTVISHVCIFAIRILNAKSKIKTAPIIISKKSIKPNPAGTAIFRYSILTKLAEKIPNSAEKLVSTASPEIEADSKKKKNKPKTAMDKKCCKKIRNACTQKKGETAIFSNGKKELTIIAMSPAKVPSKKAVKVPDTSFEKTEYSKNAKGSIKAKRKIIGIILSKKGKCINIIVLCKKMQHKEIKPFF